MREEFVTILREVLNNEAVNPETKQLAVNLMLEELGDDGACIQGRAYCIKIDDKWMPIEVYKKIRQYVLDDKKIPAIKLFRNAFRGEGLKHAKDFIENNWNEIKAGDETL